MLRAVDAVAFDDYGVLTGGRGDGDALLDVVRRLRAAGLRTALLSNAGARPAEERDELFDAVVLSGDVGLAKPDPQMFLLCAVRLAVAADRCAVVDDLVRNVRGAAQAGLVGVHHQSYDETVDQLEALCGVRLRDATPEVTRG